AASIRRRASRSEAVRERRDALAQGALVRAFGSELFNAAWNLGDDSPANVAATPASPLRQSARQASRLHRFFHAFGGIRSIFARLLLHYDERP
ncbi:MAG TPA: hypothetical protein VLI90_01425, partial [Tepidisphaeraceae bacterium]|nr:hypothetical protein [Tepidisphaeraceae bacterium]